MTLKVISLDIKPGIQRDGTQFDSPSYVDGSWVRFQRNRPRKIGGYKAIFLNATDISRGMTMTSTGGINYVVSGYNDGLEQWQTDNDDGVGSGPYQYTLSGSYFTANPNNLWQFDIGYDSEGSGNNMLIAHPGQNLADIDSTVNTPVLYNAFPSSTLTPGKVGQFSNSFAIVSGTNTFIMTTTDLRIGSGQTVTSSLFPSGTTVTSVVGQVVTVSKNATSSSTGGALSTVAVTGTAGQCSCTAATLAVNQTVLVTGTNSGTETGISAGYYFIIATNGTTTFQLSATYGGVPIITTAGTTTGLSFGAYTPSSITFDNNIAVSGGCVMIHPYLFVYGNNGLIQNSSANDINNWVSPDSNANNVSTGKIVKGLPIRGGTTSPSGLFWSLDSLIRVSYSPTTAGSSTYYWTYDLITSQTSIMSSSCLIEYDGIFYWIGVDRFLAYNGVVQEIPNTVNQNYFFDNLNYVQRQKVWATKIPRWGEIWWFYPKGDAVECTDAIIYNVREKVWYDAGQAIGARRSAGTFSEVFRFPIWAGIDENTVNTYTMWQHETGTNSIYLTNVDAIDSYFETNNIGWVTGGPGNMQMVGENNYIRLEQFEPDFIQSGQMYFYVTGKGYADDSDEPSATLYFDPTTLKLNVREQRREMRLRMGSNTQNGNYQMGKCLLSVDVGDVRSTGSP